MMLSLLSVALLLPTISEAFVGWISKGAVLAGPRQIASSGTRQFLKDENMSPEEREIALDKALKAMTSFSNAYIKNTGTKYCKDLSIPAVVIKGLAEHKVSLGAPLCPCRFYEDKEKEAKDGFWNCPCVPMRERHECHCMLFLTEENDFVGEETIITLEQVLEKSSQPML